MNHHPLWRKVLLVGPQVSETMPFSRNAPLCSVSVWQLATVPSRAGKAGTVFNWITATCSGVRGLMSNDFSRETRILLFSQPWDRKGKRRTQLEEVKKRRWRVIEVGEELKEYVASYFFNLLRSAKGNRVNLQ